MALNLHLLTGYRRFKKLLQEGATFVAFDTETTGLNPLSDRVIEIGAVKFNSNGIIDSYDQLINPKISLKPHIVELTHITDSMLLAQPVFFNIANDFLKFIDGTILVAHNAQFDLRFINAELARLNKSPLKNQAIDTLRFSRTTFPKPETTSWKLGSLAQKLGVEVKNAHRADDDARVCMEIFIRTVEEYSKTKTKKTVSLEEPLQGQLDFHSEIPSE